jgi:nucleotide-binding universal stress UspA family protein
MTGPPILVGVDGSVHSLAAVEVAVREGALRERAVRIVYGDRWAGHPAWANNDPAGELAGDQLSEPQQAIRDATDRAATAQPVNGRVPVTCEVLPGDPATVLIRESAYADVLVLGHVGRGAFAELLLGSVAIKVAAHAACPVVITRGAQQTSGDVVVGVDGSVADDAPLRFAFHEASLRGADLRAVHAWNRPALPDHAVVLLSDTGPEENAHAQMLDEALSAWSRKYPTVTVHRQLTTDPAATAIVEVSRRAQLVVLGARGQSRLPGRRLGSISHAVLHHAACPVAVVR